MDNYDLSKWRCNYSSLDLSIINSKYSKYDTFTRYARNEGYKNKCNEDIKLNVMELMNGAESKATFDITVETNDTSLIFISVDSDSEDILIII